jgi:hypothetical protein
LVKDYGYPIHLKPRFSDMLGGNAVNLDAFSFLLMPSRLSRPLRGSAARVIWAAARRYLLSVIR